MLVRLFLKSKGFAKRENRKKTQKSNIIIEKMIKSLYLPTIR